MKIGLLLHAYQPPTQYPTVTQRITEECYRPLIELLMKHSGGRVVFNMVGSLAEQLEKQGDSDLLEKLGYLATQDQITLTGTAAYHPLLAAIPESEIQRQIRFNNDINRRLIGETAYSPEGFFLPEMVYDETVGDILAKLGYSWIVLDESAHRMRSTEYNDSIKPEDEHYDARVGSKHYTLKETGMNIIFRDSTLSLALSFGQYQNIDELKLKLKDHFIDGQEEYIMLAMDAETFGHHQKHYIKILEDMILDPAFEFVLPSEILSLDLETESINPLRSTWGLIKHDRAHNRRIFARWMNPENELHGIQWRMFDLAVGIGHKRNSVDLLDKAINSDFFWWSSKKPFWHPGMLERSGNLYLEFIAETLGRDSDEYMQMWEMAQELLERGVSMHGNTVID